MPPPLLTECSFTWLRTLDYLESLVSFTPHSRASLRTLRPFTYDNVVSSWPVRPALLAGHAASQYLSSIIKPKTCTLKYRVILPSRQARPLPPSLTGFVSVNSCEFPRRNYAGGKLWGHGLHTERASLPFWFLGSSYITIKPN